MNTQVTIQAYMLRHVKFDGCFERTSLYVKINNNIV